LVSGGGKKTVPKAGGDWVVAIASEEPTGGPQEIDGGKKKAMGDKKNFTQKNSGVTRVRGVPGGA